MKVSDSIRHDIVTGHARALQASTGARHINIIVANSDDELREDLIAMLRDRFGVRAVDPRTHDVKLKWVKPDHVTDEELEPSFAPAPADTVMTITPEMLARAIATWDEEAKDKGWPERDDEDRNIDDARYVMGIMLEQKSWEQATDGDKAPASATDGISSANTATYSSITTDRISSRIMSDGAIATLGVCDPVPSLFTDVVRAAHDNDTFVTINITIDGRSAEKIASEAASNAVADRSAEQ